MPLQLLQVPADVPCPQASEVDIIERRLVDPSETYIARTIERAERQYQSLSFVFNEAQAASFSAWWRDVLLYGGMWFAAPDTWPTPAGLVVKVRRFIVAPRWQYVGVGLWRVTIDCEVRGESALPGVPIPEPSLRWDAARSILTPPEYTQPQMTFSNNDMTVTGLGKNGVVGPTISTVGRYAGKWYYEVVLNHIVGFINYSPATGFYLEHDWEIGGGGSVGSMFFANGPHRSTSFFGPPFFPPCSDGDVLGFAVDISTDCHIWVSKNGVFYSGDPVAGTGWHDRSLDDSLVPVSATNKMFPGAQSSANGTDTANGQCTIRGSLAQFLTAPPAGYSAWNGD